MNELLPKALVILEAGAYVLSSLCILATIVARLVPGKKDDELVTKASGGIFKAISYLPTIGVNPQTKKLEEAYLEMRQKMEEQK